jgi:hypothetical protein
MGTPHGRLSNTPSAIAITVCIFAITCGGSPVNPSNPGPSPTAAPVERFKVATWNIRSGMGIRGFTTTSWSSDTLNCTDQSKPLNAWGIGLPQQELERIREDQSIVAFATQEAWNCGSPTNINSILGFKVMSGERNGTALAARYGFASGPSYTKITGDDWLVGGAVCLDPACSASTPVFSAHWSVPEDAFGAAAQRTIEILGTQPVPHVLLGDLNVYRVDAWNPSVPCTGPDVGGRVQAIMNMEAAGYADAWKTTQPGEGWTGMSTRNGCGVPNGNLFKRIDYVYTKGLTAVSTTRIARAAPGADAPSDHVALIAELTRSPR